MTHPNSAPPQQCTTHTPDQCPAQEPAESDLRGGEVWKSDWSGIEHMHLHECCVVEQQGKPVIWYLNSCSAAIG
jgi:hypothetical protein